MEDRAGSAVGPRGLHGGKVNMHPLQMYPRHVEVGLMTRAFPHSSRLFFVLPRRRQACWVKSAHLVTNSTLPIQDLHSFCASFLVSHDLKHRVWRTNRSFTQLTLCCWKLWHWVRMVSDAKTIVGVHCSSEAHTIRTTFSKHKRTYHGRVDLVKRRHRKRFSLLTMPLNSQSLALRSSWVLLHSPVLVKPLARPTQLQVALRLVSLC